MSHIIGGMHGNDPHVSVIVALDSHVPEMHRSISSELSCLH